MRISLVAVVSRWGLESLVPECKGAMGLLQQVGNDRPAAGVWAVMERAHAIAIYDLLCVGECRLALDELAQAAEFMGPLFGEPASGGDQEAAP